jgi:hypothetical protein
MSAHTSSMMFCRMYPPAGNDKRLPECQLPRPTGPFIPGLSQEFRHTLIQLVELLFVQS